MASSSPCWGWYHLRELHQQFVGDVLRRRQIEGDPGDPNHKVWKQLMVWLVVSNISYFHLYLGKISNLTNIFQMGWNHQLVLIMSAPVFVRFFVVARGWRIFVLVAPFLFFLSRFFSGLGVCNKFRILRRVYNPESPGMYKTQGKQWDDLPTNWSARFLPSTVYLN